VCEWVNVACSVGSALSGQYSPFTKTKNKSLIVNAI